MSEKRELVVKRLTDGFIDRRIDVTGKSEHHIELCIRGMVRNMDLDKWCVYDTVWDETK